MSTHAVLGPSGADRWMPCPGSVALSANIPDRAGIAADEGTAYHFLASHCLTTSTNAEDFIGQCIYVPPNGEASFINGPGSTFFVDAENAEFTQRYIDNVRALAQDNELYVEQSLPIDHLTDEVDASGTGDAVILNPAQREIVVADLKFGRGVKVTAENNPQLMMYALGAVEKYKHMHAFDTARLVIHQPRADDGLPQEWVVSVEDLLAFGVKVKKAANNVWAALDLYNMFMEANAPLPQQWVDDNLFPTEKGCKFCRAKSKCPAIAEYASEVSGVDLAAPTADGFDDLDAPEPTLIEVLAQDVLDNGVVTREVVGVTQIEEIVDRPAAKVYTLSQKMDAVPIIEAWLKDIRAEVERELLLGNEVDGYKLVQGKRGNRQWDNEAAVEAVLKGFRLKNEEKYDFKLKSPTVLTKYLKDKPKWLEKLDVLIVQKDGGLSVAPADDKRPAVDVKPSADGFENETDPAGFM